MKTTLTRSALGLAVLVLLVSLAFATHGGHGAFTHALAHLGAANRGWLVVASAGLAAALICSAAAWRWSRRANGPASAPRLRPVRQPLAGCRDAGPLSPGSGPRRWLDRGIDRGAFRRCGRDRLRTRTRLARVCRARPAGGSRARRCAADH